MFYINKYKSNPNWEKGKHIIELHFYALNFLQNHQVLLEITPTFFLY